MPKKPQRPCQHPGCPRLADGLYCPEHQREANRQYNKYARDPASNKRYGRNWKRIRDRHMQEHPLCEECSKAGRLTPAVEVHHVLPLANGGTNADANLMSLCHACHMKIHGQLDTDDR